jgi:hypothetical protein
MTKQLLTVLAAIIFTSSCAIKVNIDSVKVPNINNGGNSALVGTAADYFYYAKNNIVILKGRSVSLTPSTNGTELAYSVSPALPSGLEIDSETGVISGTATSVTAAADYTVTEENEFCNLTTVVRIAVYDGYYADVVASDASDDSVADGICYSATAGGCTLRAAIETANNQAGTQMIQLSANTYNLTSALPNITGDTIIAGVSPTLTILKPSADYTNRGFFVQAANVKVYDVTMTKFDNVSAANGGAAIYVNTGSLDVYRAYFLENKTTGGWSQARNAGAIFFNAATGNIYDSQFVGNTATSNAGAVNIYSSAVTIHGSYFENNTADFGSAVVTFTNATSLIENSTFYDNYARSTGTLADDGNAQTTLKNVTIYKNRVNSTTRSAGIFSHDGTAADYTLSNTIIAANHTDGNDAIILNLASNSAATTQFVSLGHNLISSNEYAGSFVAEGDMLATDPVVDTAGPLYNGGWSKTILLDSSSPAIDAGGNASCTATDQRGIIRPQNYSGNATAFCDIGAVEMK